MKYIILTGASSGIGRELALRLGQEGNVIFLISRNLEKLKEVECKIRKNNGDAKILQCDLDKEIDKISQIMKKIMRNIDEYKCKSITLINNAAIIEPIEFIGDMGNDELLSNLNTNCVAPIILINEFLKNIKDVHTSKKVINISSGVANNPLSGWSAYSASKAAINIFLKTLSVEQGENVKIVSIDPGVVDTGIQKYIRNLQNGKFPYVKNFIEYHKELKLRNPKLVADKITELYIEKWSAKNIYEKIEY